MGGSEAQIEAVRSGELESADFSEAELAAFRFAEAMTLHASALPNATFDDLARHFDEAEIVEISMVAGLFNYINRVNEALDVEPTT